MSRRRIFISLLALLAAVSFLPPGHRGLGDAESRLPPDSGRSLDLDPFPEHGWTHPFSDEEMLVPPLEDWLARAGFETPAARAFWGPWMETDHARQTELRRLFLARKAAREANLAASVAAGRKRRRRSAEETGLHDGPVNVLLLDGHGYFRVLEETFANRTEMLVECPLTPCRAMLGKSDAQRERAHVLLAHLEAHWVKFQYGNGLGPRKWQKRALLSLEPQPPSDVDGLADALSPEHVEIFSSWSRFSEVPTTYYGDALPPIFRSPASASSDLAAFGLLGTLRPRPELHSKLWAGIPPVNASKPWLAGAHPPFATRIANCKAEPRASFLRGVESGGLAVEHFACFRAPSPRGPELGNTFYNALRDAENAMLYSHYPLAPGLESRIMLDYATEKMDAAHLSGSLPVVLAHPLTAEEHAPGGRGSYVSAASRSPEELGAYLSKLVKDRGAYDRHFGWRLKGKASEGFERRKRLAFARNGGRDWLCRLCGIYAHYWDLE
ncbi:hypothetical protein DFJ74DRAFT_753425 [Hyaloraphidium curvatum]|nr:hypothetical protein DFJ74DRAFT_753425 [Hyaloraphidium curvatum]